jgi:iron complex outermembrane receptor protein
VFGFMELSLSQALRQSGMKCYSLRLPVILLRAICANVFLVEPKPLNNKVRNKMNAKKSLLVTAMAFLFSSGGGLQLVQAEENGQAAKAGSGQSKLMLEEVMVTAQKRAESLQDVSVAVSWLGGDRLTDGNLAGIEDIQAMVPNVSAGTDFGIAKLFIRGIGLNSSFAGVDPGVALHVDGAVISSSYAQMSSFFDLERIEVLRGPQGTLYGRNAVGGSFNLITRKPTDELEGYLRVTLGDYDQTLVEGAVGGPISETVKGRVAVRTDSRSGYGKNIVSGKNIDDANKRSVRAHLQFDLSEDMDFLLSVDAAKENDAGLALKAVETANNIDPMLPPPTGATVPGAFATDIRDIASDIDSENRRDIWGINGTFNWVLNNNWTLSSITNYRDVDVLIRQDLDISSVVSSEIQTNKMSSVQFSEELQFSYESDKLHGLIAAFYFRENFTNRNNIGFASPDQGAGVTTTVLLTGDIDIESFAVFTNFTYDITDNLAIKLGGRVTHEIREADNTFGLDFSFVGGTPFTIPFKDKRSFDDFSPAIGIDWKPMEDILLYASYAKGFKAGSIQSGQTSPILDPEKVDNYEVGFKGAFLDKRMTLNLSGFYYEYSDLQLDRTIPDGFGGFVPIFENGGDAEGQGAEAEVSWLLSENFKLGAHLSYLDAQYGDVVLVNPLVSDPVTTFASINIDGNNLRQSPKLSWSIRGEYSLSLSGGANITSALELAFKDDQFFTEFNQDEVSQEAYTLVNGNIKYQSPDEKVDINIWAKNLTDEEVYSGMFVVSSGASNIIGGSLLPPRTFGVTFGYHF